MSRRRRYFLATCTESTGRPQQFLVRDERDDWAERHTSATGHQVSRTEQWRGDEPAQEQTQTQPGPQTLTLLCVGGPKHGQEVTIGADETQWLDLTTAQTYHRQVFTAGQNNPLVDRPTELWCRFALVWEGISTPQQAIMTLANWLYGQWAEQGGEKVPADVAVPQPHHPNGGHPQ